MEISYFIPMGSKTPSKFSESKEVRWGSTAHKVRLVQLIISGDEENPTD